MARSVGSLAVDQTLRLARDAIERDVANYRIGVFTAAMLLTATLRVLGIAEIWTPALFFSCALTYALLLRWFLHRYGNPPGLAVAALLVDLTSTVMPFLLVQWLQNGRARAANVTFAAYIIPAALLLVLFINSLRNSARLSLAGGSVAVSLFALTVPRMVGFHPGQLSVGMIILLAGIIGIAAAKQARKSLDSFARLQLLQRYLPPAAVERIMREHPDEALALGGRLATVTLLSADLRGFTAMSEKLTPTEVMKQLNAYHGAMIDVIERHGGAIDKFIGDGTLVVFGLGHVEGGPTHADAASAAVECAKAMLQALDSHNDDRTRAGSPPLRMGIAVHTGSVIAGNLGVPGRRLEFTVIGDAVNTVSRLEGETKTSGCPMIVSEVTHALLPDTTGLRELSPVSLRGKQSTVRVFGFAPEAAA